MEDKFRQALDQIHAEQDLKEKTRQFLAQTQPAPRPHPLRRWLPAVACLVVLLLAGSGAWLYFTPTAVVSIDVNPSFELQLNRFDRVLEVTPLNEDAAAFTEQLDLTNQDCSQAVEEILQQVTAQDLVVITVAGTGQTQTRRLYGQMQTCTAQAENVSCEMVQMEQVAEAHEMGLSCGRYRAFLQLQALDASVTVEQIQQMSMREIWDRISELSGTQQEHGNQSGGHHWGRKE